MRTVAIAFVLLTGASAPADEASPPAVREPGPAPIPADVQQLRDQWMHCSATVAKAHLRSSRPATTTAWCGYRHSCAVIAISPEAARVLAKQLEAWADVVEADRERKRVEEGGVGKA